jgi:hypothetical protein
MDIFCLGAGTNPGGSNNAQWLTEVRRLHQAQAESATASPYFRGPENGKREEKYWYQYIFSERGS